MSDGSAAPQLIHVSDFEPVSSEVLALLPEGLVRTKNIIPLAYRDGHLLVAVPAGEKAIKPEGLKMVAGCPVELLVASLEEIQAFIGAHYGVKTAPEVTLTIIQPEIKSPAIKPLASDECDALLRQLLEDAVANRATEILLEKDGARVRVRERIRGILVSSMKAAWTDHEAKNVFDIVFDRGARQESHEIRWAEWRHEFVSRGELWFANMTLSETAEFGLLSIRLGSGRERPFEPEAWGMGPHQARVMENFLVRRQGVVLFCGIESDDLTGNLHACARTLATPDKHLIVVESYLEEWFPSIEQLSSRGDAALFSDLLRVSFRHAPDAVVANPLQKKEDFEMCFMEALKGRLVLARMFARDTAEALVQLMNLGIEPYLIGSGLLGIVAQRAFRLLCPQCQEADSVTREQVRELGIPIAMQPTTFYRGKGCDNCQKTGFDKETNLFELLEMTDEMRLQLQKGIKMEAIRAVIKTSGMMTLRQIAVHKAINGQTSLAEVLRITP